MLRFLIIGGALLGGLLFVLIVVTLASDHRKKPKKDKKREDKQKPHDKQLESDIILNTIEDGVVFINTQKTIQVFNPGASKITGWPQDEAIGLDYQSVFKLVNEKGQEYTDQQNPFSQVFGTQTVIRDSQATLISRANRRIALHISVSPLFNNERVMTGAIAVFRDISEERSEQRQRAEFISTASHEMRTPVAAIEGYLALAMNDRVSKIDQKARDYLIKAHTSTQHLGQLFQDLLTSAKAEDGRLSSHPSVVEMGDFLEHLTEDLRFAAEKKGLGIEYVIGATGDTIDASSGNGKTMRPLYYTNADPDRIREVITNLFDNAVKYTDAGKISIGLTGDNTVVQFYIRDTGAGIPTEDVPHLFQKFYRVDNSTTRTVGGTGLGLFIARKIVELYNGRIWVESEAGKGSTFFVNLPRIDTARAEQLKSQLPTRDTDTSTNTGAPITDE